MHGTGPGWLFLTGSPEDIELLRRKLGYVDLDPEVDKDQVEAQRMVRFGNEPPRPWAACQGQASPEWMAKEIAFVVPRAKVKDASCTFLPWQSPTRAAALPRGRRRIFIVAHPAAALPPPGSARRGLRLAGYGRSYPLFVPVPGAPGFLRANLDVVRRFMVDERDTPNLWIRPVYFRRQQDPGDLPDLSCRESRPRRGTPTASALPRPACCNSACSARFPERKIEVVTTAMSAVSTYTLLDFSREILEQRPDAVVIYAGHNEYVGVLGVGSGFSAAWAACLLVLSLTAKCKRFGSHHFTCRR